MATEPRLVNANAIKYREKDEYCGNGNSRPVRYVTKEDVAELPTVDAAEVVHAEWRIDGFCTNCHYRADVQSIGFNCTGGTRIEYKRTKFCPECGAKMDGERRRFSEANLRTER